MTIPLPNADSLLAGMATLEASLCQFESQLAAQLFERHSADNAVSITANGLGRIVAMQLAPALVATGNAATLSQQITPVLNEALAAASAAASTAAAAAARSWQIPGLPGVGSALPDYAGFSGTIAGLSAGALTEFDWLQSTEATFQFPPVTVVLGGCPPRVTSLTIDSPVDETPNGLGGDITVATNGAIDDAKNPEGFPDDLIDITETRSPQLGRFTVYGTREVRIDDAVKIQSADGKSFGWVGSSGTATTYLAVSCEVGTVYSTPKVELRRDAKVNGDLLTTVPATAEPATPPPAAHVTGRLDEHAVFALPEVKLDITFPSTNLGDKTVLRDKTMTLAPGAYNNVLVNGNGELRLTAGLYTMNELSLESGSKLYADETGGPVRVYMKSKFTFRGTVNGPASRPKPNVYFGVAGTEVVNIETGFIGTVVAPNTKLDIKTATHQASFFGRDIEIHSNAIVRPWPSTP